MVAQLKRKDRVVHSDLEQNVKKRVVHGDLYIDPYGSSQNGYGP